MKPEQSLLPCPMCGGEAAPWETLVETDTRWFVRCDDCGLQTKAGSKRYPRFETKAETIAAWNRRQLAAPLSAELPPLPHCARQMMSWVGDSKPQEYFTADQMQEYARAAQRAAPHAQNLSVKLAKMSESNGNVWWSVYLAKSDDAQLWDCHEVYNDPIKGRAEYEADKLKHFLGLGPQPDILAYDTDAPHAQGSGKDAHAAAKMRSALWAIAKTLDDHELRSYALDAYEAAAAPHISTQSTDSKNMSITEPQIDISAPHAQSGKDAQPVNCREAGPGKGLCFECANGNYERCLYVAAAAPQEAPYTTMASSTRECINDLRASGKAFAADLIEVQDKQIHRLKQEPIKKD